MNVYRNLVDLVSINHEAVEKCIRMICACLGWRFGVQQDAQEFLLQSGLLAALKNHGYNHEVSVRSHRTCNNCDWASIGQCTKETCIILNMYEDLTDGCCITDYIKHFQCMPSDMVCPSCQNQCISEKVHFEDMPKYLIIWLARYEYSDHKDVPRLFFRVLNLS